MGRTDRFVADRVNASHDADFLDYALGFAVSTVNDKIEQLCYPVVRRANADGSFAPTNLRARWGFRNLLGAMYLQMYSLMTSGGERPPASKEPRPALGVLVPACRFFQ